MVADYEYEYCTRIRSRIIVGYSNSLSEFFEMVLLASSGGGRTDPNGNHFDFFDRLLPWLSLACPLVSGPARAEVRPRSGGDSKPRQKPKHAHIILYKRAVRTVYE
jgi:hypothetical protein